MKSQAKIDFFQFVSIQVKGIKINGLWFFIPYPKLSIQFWLHVFVRVFIGLFVFTIPPIGQIAYVVKLFASGNFEIHELAASINLILTELLVSLKLLDLFFRRNLLTQLIDQLDNKEFHRLTHRNLLENAIKLSQRLFWGLMFGSSMDVFFHVVVVPGLNGFRTLPVKMDLILIDVNEPPYFDYVCFYEIIYKPVVVIVYISLQTMPWSLLLFAMAQLDILIDNFKNMEKLVKATMTEKRCGEDEAFKDVFNSFVLHHRAIIRFVNTVEVTFGGQFALTLILSSGVICTTGVQFFAIESPSKDLVGVFWVLAYLQIFILILFTDCYFGNSVYIKSTDLSTVAYGSPWLKMPQELKKNLVVVIARAQKPLEITAYNLVPVSLPTFTKGYDIFEVWRTWYFTPMLVIYFQVMNWTYKAFAVMNGMKK